MQSFDLQGIARPKQEAFLRFPNIGQIRKIHASEGQQVHAGELLVSLDDRAQAAEVAVARVAAESTASIKQAELALAQATRGLQLVLQARNVDASSSFEVEAKQNEQGQLLALLEQQRELHRSALAQLELAQVLKDQMTLRAPFSGQVVLINVKEGNMVDPDRTVVQIADLSNLEVELYLPTHLFGTLEIGERKWLLAGPPVNRPLPATISYISPVIEPTGGTFLVRFEIKNEETTLPAGFEVWYQDK